MILLRFKVVAKYYMYIYMPFEDEYTFSAHPPLPLHCKAPCQWALDACSLWHMCMHMMGSPSTLVD